MCPGNNFFHEQYLIQVKKQRRSDVVDANVDDIHFSLCCGVDRKLLEQRLDEYDTPQDIRAEVLNQCDSSCSFTDYNVVESLP